ncbi:MAG: aminopeptidase P family protein [bacterium]|nr:aminopeptidase P family protein [bacterium]
MTDRLTALRQRLSEVECDGFVSLSPPLNQWLTGFRGSTSAVVVTGSEARFLCDFRYTEQAGDQVGGGFSVEEVEGGLPTRAGECLNGSPRIAFEPATMTVAQQLDLQKACDGQLQAAPDVVSALRMVKTPEEIALIREAQELAEGVLAGIVDSLEAGVTEREVAARFEYEFKKRGASGASFDTIALFGARSSLPHGEPGNTPLQAGDVVLFDFGCRRAGYCSDLTRTYAFGTIPAVWFEEVYDVTLTAQRRALEAARPGMTGRELDAVARDLIEEAGFGDRFGHGLGHGVGIEVHEGPRLSKQGDVVLEPGMVVTIEPGIYQPGRGGVRIEDLVAITETGCENLTTAPKELKVIDL